MFISSESFSNTLGSHVSARIQRPHPPLILSSLVLSVVFKPFTKPLALPHLSAGKWEWLSDSPSLLPPCDGAVSYYSQFGRVPGFTSAAGRRFRGVLDEHLNLLRWPEGVKASIT